MAALQRKLVHKQFNSPMGLYSAQNVKETLDRELKAFGEDGIEVDESLLKPKLNLANSAVFRALEEEENEQQGVLHKRNRHQQQQQQQPQSQQPSQEPCKNTTRESRPRQRIIVDRDTVLKINRRGSRHRSRDHSWPPPPKNPEDRSRSVSVEHHFDEKICHQHRIDSIAKKFDHPDERYKSTDSLNCNITHTISDRRSRTPEWRPTNNNKVAEITFQVHVGIVEPKKQYFEGIATTNRCLREVPASTKVAESRYQPSKPASHFIDRPQTASLDRFTCRNKRLTQLPPQKPRSHSSGSRLGSKSPTWTKEHTRSKSPVDLATTIWPSSLSERKSVTIKLTPSSNQPSGNQINYDYDPISMHNNQHRDQRKPAKPAAPLIIDCSSLSKKTQPRNTNVTSEANLNNGKHHKQQQHFHPSTKSYDGNLPPKTETNNDATTNVKLNANPTTTTTTVKPQLNVNLNSKSNVQPKSDDATSVTTCVRSIDLIDDTQHHQQSTSSLSSSSSVGVVACNEKLHNKQENIVSTLLSRPQQQDTANKTLTRNENKFQKDTISTSTSNINGDKYPRADGKENATASTPTIVQSNGNKSPSECKTKNERRKGIYYTDGEYLFGPFGTDSGEEEHAKDEHYQPKVTVIPIEVEKSSPPSNSPTTNGIEISNLESKCGKIQKSITEDLRQIDRYMEQAKMALNRLQFEHNISPSTPPPSQSTIPIVIPSKVMIVETPLQAMIRRVFHKPLPLPHHRLRTPSPILLNGNSFMTSSSSTITRVENVPVVEQALFDLSNLTAVLASRDATEIPSHSRRVLSPVVLSMPSRQPTPPSVVVVDEISDDAEVVTGRSQSSLSEATTATANSPFSVVVTDEEIASNQVQQEKEIIQSKNILAGYLVTKKDQEDLMAKASTLSLSKPQSKIANTTISHNELRDSDTGHSSSITKKDNVVAGNSRWQVQLANTSSTKSSPSPGSNEKQQNSINNKDCPPRRTPSIDGDAPPPPPPPPPPPQPVQQSQRTTAPAHPTTTTRTRTPSPVNNLKYRVNGLFGHDVGLVTSMAIPANNNNVDGPTADRTGRARNRKSDDAATKVRSLSQPPPFEYLTESVPSLQSTTTSTIDLVGDFGYDDGDDNRDSHRSYHNISPCLYFPGPFHATTGYKRVAWPPVSEQRTVREFTPQPATQPPHPHQQQHQQPPLQQSNYQRPGASPIPAANQGGHYHPIQQEQQSSQQHNTQEPYYLQQQRPSQAPGNSTVSFRGGQAQSPAYNTPKPNPHQQQYHPQSQPQYQQQQQQQYQAPTSPEPQPHHQYQQQQYQPPQADNNQQHLDEPSRGRWGHVASPVPQRTGYVQNYQPAPAAAPRQPSPQPPQQSFEQQHYGSQQQQNHYGAPSSSVPQVNQSYDRQPAAASYGGGPPQQHQNNFAPAPYAPATAVPQQYYQAHLQSQPQNQYSQTSQPIDNHYNYYSQPEHQQQQQQLQHQQYRGESPGIITLRKEAPITQQPAPVYTSQPAAASYRGGSSMRGDLKWPPPEYKEQAAVENEERRRVAQGPVCRPRRINKDYTQFFAKNALSHHYPSYKTPPGTQHIYSSY